MSAGIIDLITNSAVTKKSSKDKCNSQLKSLKFNLYLEISIVTIRRFLGASKTVIKKLHISNFKSIKELDLDCKRINIFIGEPNTGKSNILEAIGLLSNVDYRFQNILADFVRFESMLDLFYDRNLSDPIDINFDEKLFSLQFANGYFYSDYTSPEFQQQRHKYRLSQFDYNGICQSGGNLPGNERQVFSEFKYYRFTKLNEFGDKSSDFLLPPDGKNLLHVILTRKDLRAAISTLFKKYGYRVVFKPPEGKIEIQKEQEDIIVSIPFGLSSETLQRITFYLAAIYSNKNSVISFEEPEAHAFPYYMKYLAEKIAMNYVDNQYFIVTHNPYFLMSIIEKAPKENIATFATYFEDYQTKVRPLTSEETEDALSMGADLFFNIDKFIGKDQCIGN